MVGLLAIFGHSWGVSSYAKNIGLVQGFTTCRNNVELARRQWHGDQE